MAGGYFDTLKSTALNMDASSPGVANASYDSLGRLTGLKSGGTGTRMLREYSYETDTGRLATLVAHSANLSDPNWVNLRLLYDAVGNPTAVVLPGPSWATCSPMTRWGG
jgi:hypothetical protein